MKAAEVSSQTRSEQSWQLCVAPMMGYTDRHFRHLLRAIAPNAVLYTEMVTSNALLRRGPRIIEHNDIHGHTALQLGGSEPADLAQCAAIAADCGYRELNLNVGCPSPRVSRGRFGACLMAEPGLVHDCVAAMRAASSLPITVKCRLGIDQHDDAAFLHAFVDRVAPQVDALIVHARIALLQGLTPEQNREIPPLQYPRVYALQARHPGLHIVVNGGISALAEVQAHRDHGVGVMLGRAICAQPYFLSTLERRVHVHAGADIFTVLRDYVDYMHRERARGVPFAAMARRLLGLFNGLPGARQFRRTLTELCHRGCADPTAVLAASACIDLTESPAQAA